MISFASMSQAQDLFDPFSIQDDVGQAAPTRSQSRTQSFATANSKRSKLEAMAEERTPKPLPPRLNVRLMLHEEVSSTAVIDPDGEGGSMSQLSIEGKVSARVESSNAHENIPFALHVSGPMASLANFTCNEHCTLEDDDNTLNTPYSQQGGNIGTVRCKVDIPKSKVAGCEIFTYSMNVRSENMPILVQTKSTISGRICRVSVQVRSNLSNLGDLSNFTIIVAIPSTLKGNTVKVTRGDHGLWDANKRIVTWKIGSLPHGESCLVSAEAEISQAVANLLHENPFEAKLAEGKIKCPVLVRCLSEVDQVSDLALSVKANRGDPATIVQNQMRSYQLLHRVAGGP